MSAQFSPAPPMERLRGPIDPFLAGEGRSSECLELEDWSSSSGPELSYDSLIPDHYHQMPFLQLLQSAMQVKEVTKEKEEEEQKLHFQFVQQQQQQQYQHQQALLTSFPPEANFQLLRRLQSHQDKKWTAEIDSFRAVEQLESCVTHASESQSDRGADGHEPDHHRQLSSGTTRSLAAAGTRERKKRKRLRAAAASTKSAEEAESQRMTHIAVERNRRRLMNDHLASLRAVMPPSFVQRGDQASIIGGAIDFIKELEQLFFSLQAEKRQRTSAAVSSTCTAIRRSSSEEDACTVPAAPASLEGCFISPQYTSYSQSQQQSRLVKEEEEEEEDGEESPEAVAEEVGVDVEATVVQGHVNLKVVGRRRAGQLVRAIAALEELRLSVLHLYITSLDPSSILYSLNLRMEEGCTLGTADEIATAVHQIFGYINSCR